MDFRKATLEDVPALAELRKQQLIDEGLLPLQNIDAQLKHYFSRCLMDASFIGWLAIDGAIIATSGLCFYQLPPSYANPSGKIAYITNVFTVKTHRRQGIASILLDKILQEVRIQGVSVVRLHASSDGKDLYAKFGFSPAEGYMALNL
ncbi:GNAT family N-acetyltransferase [Oscillospiraceae bacterium MB08-C2-2]|nr:GNAT family N-acetyltransferase [Oscillospiraceae bacterium MB08-C2-2]